MTDPISDMLARIRNGQNALLSHVDMPYSKIKQGIAVILKKEGYIVDFSVEEQPRKTLKLKLKYDKRRGVIGGLRRVSSPGLRRYVGGKEVPRVRGGLGIAILSTSRGLMTGLEARRQNVGGELLCYVW